MRKILCSLIIAMALTVMSGLCFALVSIEDWSLSWMSKRPWPSHYPSILEPYRRNLKVFGVMNATHETVFELTFDNQSQFEQIWPQILKIKSNGSPLILEKAPSSYVNNKMVNGIRILGPTDGGRQVTGGVMLSCGPPWPDSVKSPKDELPEYVVATTENWIPFNEDIHKHKSRSRARVDIVLVVDGKVVDLNRIPLPANTRIIDNRFNTR
jgi:hypothetical protein